MNSVSFYYRASQAFSDGKLSTIAGAACAIGGGGACLSIGGVRFLPFTTMIAGLGFLLRNIYNQPIKQSQELNRPVQSPQEFRWNLAKTIFAIGIIAVPLFYYMRIAGCAPQDVLPLFSANPHRPMATRIPEASAIDSVVAEVFYKPNGLWCWQYCSLSDLQNQVKKDWQAVHALGISHLELADYLKDLLEAAPYCYESNLFFYDPTQMRDSTIGQASKMQILNGCKHPAKGVLFCEDNTDYSHCKNRYHSSYNILTVTNPINGVHMEMNLNYRYYFSTNTTTEITLDNIRKYGYYGMPDSEYRIDPIELVALLTGQSVCALQTVVGRNC